MLKEIREHHFIASSLTPNSTVIDLGAYLGEFSEKINKFYGCYVFAFEANPTTFQRTYHNNKVKKFNFIVSDYNGNTNLFLADNPEGHSTYRSHKDANGSSVSMPSIRLDSFIHKEQIKKIHLLKVDIEGSEIQLFNSMSDKLLTSIDQITVEFHDFISELNHKEDVLKIKKRLYDIGFYEIVFVYPNKDVLFINKHAKIITPLSFYTLKYIVLSKHRYCQCIKKIKKLAKTILIFFNIYNQQK